MTAPDGPGGGSDSAERGPLVVVISGPGGVGKGTVVRRMLERDPGLWLSRSWTTRERRPGEDPEAYHFVSRRTFDEHIARGGFLEWVDFLDYRQGTPIPDPPVGATVILEIDIVGAATVSSIVDDALCIFLDAPSEAEQEARMLGRGDAPERVATRLAKSVEERAMARRLGARLVVNDDVEATVDEVLGIIDERRVQDRRP